MAQPETAPKEGSRKRARVRQRRWLNTWSGLILGLLGLVVSISSFCVSCSNTRRLARNETVVQRSEVDRQLDEAWDLLSGGDGSAEATRFPLASGQLEKARRLIEDQALNKMPNYPRAHRLHGDYLRAARRLDDAVADYRLAAHLDPEDAATHNNLAIALGEKGDLAAALVAYGRALELAPNNSAVRCNRGVAYANLARFDEALVDFREAARRNPISARILVNLAAALAQEGRTDEAIDFAERAAELEPGNSACFRVLGDALANAKRWEEALAQYQRATGIQSSDASAANNLGAAFLALGRNEEALSALAQAVAAAPDDAFPRGNQGVAQLRLGRPNEAERSFRWVIDAQTRLALPPMVVAAAHFNQAALLAAQGRSAEAASARQRAVQLDSTLRDRETAVLVVLREMGEPESALISSGPR
jgi:tetratricopeptide (TPR) repeat protein